MFGLDDILGAAADYAGGGGDTSSIANAFANVPDAASTYATDSLGGGDQGINEWAKLLQQNGGDSSGLGDLSSLGADQNPNEWAKLLQQDSSAPGSIYDAASGANSSSITGIPWIDKIIHGMGTTFEKNPLGMLSGGLGILNALDRMKSGNTSPGQAQMSSLLAQHAGSPGNSAITTPVKAPYGATAAQLIAIPQVKAVYNGPLTQTAYNPLNRK